jgi:hypothetical protein
MEHERSGLSRALGWAFRNRQTGRLTIAQVPNAPLLLWIAFTGASRLFQPRGAWGTFLQVGAFLALAVWAIDEMARGVNPWRRLLGTAVLAVSTASLLF